MDHELVAPPPPPPIVLLVEDDPDTREMYHAALEFEGFWVADAPSADEALNFAAQLQPDAIVTDLGLKGRTDGVAFAQQLRSEARTAHIPILAVTGRDRRDIFAPDGVFAEILTKPIAPDELIRRIRDLLAHSEDLRKRSAAARAKVPHLVAKSVELMTRSERLSQIVRDAETILHACPRCGTALQWQEQRVVLQQKFEYFRPCRNGCGLFYYDHGRAQLLPLID
jgi:DNA-binding response OmpR family regulator